MSNFPSTPSGVDRATRLSSPVSATIGTVDHDEALATAAVERVAGLARRRESLVDEMRSRTQEISTLKSQVAQQNNQIVSLQQQLAATREDAEAKLGKHRDEAEYKRQADLQAVTQERDAELQKAAAREQNFRDQAAEQLEQQRKAAEERERQREAEYQMNHRKAEERAKQHEAEFHEKIRQVEEREKQRESEYQINLRNMKSGHDSSSASLAGRHQSEISALKERYQSEMNRQQSDIASKMSQQQSQYQNELSKLREEQRQELAKQREQQQSEVNSLREMLSSERLTSQQAIEEANQKLKLAKHAQASESAVLTETTSKLQAAQADLITKTQALEQARKLLAALEADDQTRSLAISQKEKEMDGKLLERDRRVQRLLGEVDDLTSQNAVLRQRTDDSIRQLQDSDMTVQRLKQRHDQELDQQKHEERKRVANAEQQFSAKADMLKSDFHASLLREQEAVVGAQTELRVQKRSWDAERSDLLDHIARLERQVEDHRTGAMRAEDDAHIAREQLSQKNTRLLTLEGEAADLRSKLSRADMELASASSRNAEMQKALEAERIFVGSAQAAAQEATHREAAAAGRLHVLEAGLATRETELNVLSDTHRALQATIDEQGKTNVAERQKGFEMESTIHNNKSIIQQLEQRLADKDREMRTLRDAHDKIIQEYQQEKTRSVIKGSAQEEQIAELVRAIHAVDQKAGAAESVLIEERLRSWGLWEVLNQNAQRAQLAAVAGVPISPQPAVGGVLVPPTVPSAVPGSDRSLSPSVLAANLTTPRSKTPAIPVLTPSLAAPTLLGPAPAGVTAPSPSFFSPLSPPGSLGSPRPFLGPLGRVI